MKKILLTLILLLTFVIAPKALAQEGDLAEFIFDADMDSVSAGETVLIELNVDSKSTPINAVDLRFTYPAEQFSLENLNTNDSDFEILAEENVENGLIKIVRGTTEPKEGVNHLGSVELRASQDTNLSGIDYSPDSAVMSGDNENILEGSRVETVKPGDSPAVADDTDGEISFFDRIKQWNASFWEAIFSFFTNLFGGN